MKKLKIIFGIGLLIAAGLVFVAADHIDAPAVTGQTSDITDFYAFQGEDTDNIVFIANVQGLLSPSATANATFDEDLMIEINIDNTGDNVEDLVIQAIPRAGRMFFYGPSAPDQTGLESTLITSGSYRGLVRITPYGSAPIIENRRGLKYFAGPRDDPFFFDFAQYSQILAGNAGGFNDPGSDTFAGTNVMSIVVEVPKALIGGSGTINTWVETKRRQ
ncbi:uncharacterized protein DUF4331 [Ulvibacter antarcticus]|uniref:Uncharacterized protein DUF4331 n=1 Tax=Ulvibacter antarcticus TaxID=442714 RepID=A0A3L9Z2L1_9FLAO|nr:DUF4331 family protein [Ulvibacter antarcticus]RMA64545.1 uncharacterized protein DUF4331 [Ulvibacter antarcticus]